MRTPKLAYLICPVRNCTPEQRAAIHNYVQTREKAGTHHFHYPPRDVDQRNDDGGWRICLAHRRAMAKCQEIHVWWDNNSPGSHFDLGMAFMMDRLRQAIGFQSLRFYIANEDEVRPLEEKSFQNVLTALAGHTKQRDL